MVPSFYNLREQPFGMTPDPRYLYLSPTHREALASLLYGITSGCGFVTLIAKPGMGKTTLLFQLLQNLERSSRVVFIFQTPNSARDLMRSLLADLGVEEHDDLISMHFKLNEILLEQAKAGRRLVVVIDEAQNLENGVLEELRMLSNFETPREKLLQIVLAGQPQLAEKLASPGLVQLRQRISILSRLQPLAESEVERYIDNRLRVAGYNGDATLFTPRALALIANASEGIPRNINNICFNALSLGCAMKRRTIGPEIIFEVLQDLDIEALKARDAVVTRSRPSSVVGTEPWKRRNLFSWKIWPVFAIASVLLLALAWPSFKSARVLARMRATRVIPRSVRADDPAPAERDLRRSESAVGANAGVSSVDANPGGKSDTALETVSASVVVAKGDDSPLRVITVQPGQTLFQISVMNLGAYNANVLRQIRALNPWLGDNPDLIEPGDRIRLPAMAAGLKGVQKRMEQPSNIPAAGVKKP